MRCTIDYGESKLFYYKYGVGQKAILLFHGFGQDHTAFSSWIEVLKNDYTVYSFDLFFHGESVWVSPNALAKEDWKNIIELFLQKEKINHFELAGFSMGGKFVLSTLESFPDRIKKIALVAPDGIKVNFWYRLATYPFLMRALFESFVSKPKVFFTLARILESLGLINKYLLRFVMVQMDTEEKRKRVYCTWIIFSCLKFDMKLVAKLLNEKVIPLKIFVGKFDKVIPEKDMQRLLKYVPLGKLEILETGHNNLIDKAIEFF
ncbi:MAG: alpha/beta hydrolase [Bacteroidetes bacterium]|nr:alpha/beta hydrolase [Bacteroidota bacterium]MBI3482582.1 alpha/beta hydrolase [Bacteroidota bacterium]